MPNAGAEHEERRPSRPGHSWRQRIQYRNGPFSPGSRTDPGHQRHGHEMSRHDDYAWLDNSDGVGRTYRPQQRGNHRDDRPFAKSRTDRTSSPSQRPARHGPGVNETGDAEIAISL